MTGSIAALPDVLTFGTKFSGNPANFSESRRSAEADSEWTELSRLVALMQFASEYAV